MARHSHVTGFLVSVVLGITQVVHAHIDNAVCPRTTFSDEIQDTCSEVPKAHGDEAAAGSGWQGPGECVDEYCIYSNRGVGDGIVLVTTIDNAKLAAQFPEISASRSSPPAFEVASVPGKGIGLVARRGIANGEQVMASPPAVMVQVDAHRELAPDDRAYLYGLAVEALPRRTREAFMQQMGDTVEAKLDKNGFGMHIGTDDGGGHIGGFPGASRMNHDCRPNVAYRIANMTHITTAVRDIAAGEELTISYIHASLPRAERQERLAQWGFACRCAHCAMDGAAAAQSDARVRLIAELEAALDDPHSRGVTTETGAQLVGLYEAERLDIYLGPAYVRAALNYGLFADEERAREYAEKAIGALMRQSGPAAGDLPSMRALAQDPKSHWTWGRRKVVKIPVEDLKFA